MEQVGIKAMRPGPSGRTAAAANPFPQLPDALVLKNGKKATSANVWWSQRRPEIVEDFEREVIGKVPKNIPKVTWTVTEQVNREMAGAPLLPSYLNS